MVNIIVSLGKALSEEETWDICANVLKAGPNQQHNLLLQEFSKR